MKERDTLLEEEKMLLETSAQDSCPSQVSSPTDEKKYICDFSDGEHGHELFAWQHRYYGSDASVHLGSSRLARGSGNNQKSSKVGINTSKHDTSTSADIKFRLSKIFANSKLSHQSDEELNTFKAKLCFLKDSYDKILSTVDDELKEVCVSLCVLYARKLVMHVVVSCSDKFTLASFLPNSMDTPWSSREAAEGEVSRSLFHVIEHCTSLSSSGWVGEAGAMAVAAEALGLGISSFDHNFSSSIPAGMCSVSNNNDQVLIPCGVITQCLTSATLIKQSMNEKDSSLTFAACAEAAICSEAGGSISFVRSGLQNAAATSRLFRQVLLAAVRRAVRLLAAIEYDSEEGLSEVSFLLCCYSSDK